MPKEDYIGLSRKDLLEEIVWLEEEHANELDRELEEQAKEFAEKGLPTLIDTLEIIKYGYRRRLGFLPLMPYIMPFGYRLPKSSVDEVLDFLKDFEKKRKEENK